MDWHRKLGHICFERLLVTIEMMDNVEDEVNVNGKKPQHTAYIESISERAPLQHPFHRYTRPLELTHSEMTRKIGVTSLCSAPCFFVFFNPSTAMKAA